MRLIRFGEAPGAGKTSNGPLQTVGRKLKSEYSDSNMNSMINYFRKEINCLEQIEGVGSANKKMFQRRKRIKQINNGIGR